MNTKFLVSLLSLLSLAPMPRAQSLDNGWQVAQAPPSMRPLRRPSGPPAPSAPAATNAPSTSANPAANPLQGPPAPASGPAAPAVPALPSPATRGGASAAIPTAAAASNEVADIYYNFTGVPIEQLLGVYAELINRTILRPSKGAPGAVPDQSYINLKTETPLTHYEAIQAIEMILGMNGVGIALVGDKFVKITTQDVIPTEGGPISTNTNNMPQLGKMITQIIQVKYADLKDLLDVLKPFQRMPNAIIGLPSTQTLILRDYAENVNRMAEMVRRIDVETPLSIKPHVIPIKYAMAADIASALSALGASGGASVGKSNPGAGFGSHAAAGSSGIGGISGNGVGGIGSQQGGGYSGSPMGSTSPLASSATSGRSSFQNNLNRLVQSAATAGQFQLFGLTKIIADERTNSLLVFCNDDDFKMIMDIVNKLDIVLPQVLIDAIILEINLTGNETTGISYLAQREGGSSFTGAGGINNLSSAAQGFLGGGSSSSNGVSSTPTSTSLAGLPGGFSYFSKWGNDLNVVMEAIANDSRVNVLSRPRIQTSHAVPADLFIGNTVPYVTGTYNYGYGSGPSSQYQQLQVGIHLSVVPLINTEGLVVMDIQADVEQLGPGQEIQGVGLVPTTTKRTAEAKVAVKDGDTIILGGFISDSRTKANSGVPYLKDIPWIGSLFNSRSVQNLRTELIMLMKPTVLPTPEVAAIVTKQERNKLAGVKQAEIEIRREEQQNWDSIEKEMQKDAEARAAKAAKEAKERAKHPGATNGFNPQAIPALEE